MTASFNHFAVVPCLALIALFSIATQLKTCNSILQIRGIAREATTNEVNNDSRTTLTQGLLRGSTQSSDTLTQRQQLQYDKEDLHAVSKLLQSGQKIAIITGPQTSIGLGVFTRGIAKMALYYNDNPKDRRTIVVDQSQSTTYRWNATHGLYTGFFDTTFPVINDASLEYQRIEQEMKNHMQQTGGSGDVANHVKYYSTPQLFQNQMKKDYNYDSTQPEDIEDPIKFIPNNDVLVWRKPDSLLKPRTMMESVLLFDRLSQFLCNNIRFSDATKSRINDTLYQANIPPPESISSLLPSSSESASFAFHIRRGDKVKFEARAYQAEEYVSKLLKMVPDLKQRSKIKHCYVATDSPEAVEQLKVELQNSAVPNGIDCTLHHLTTSGYETDRSTADTIHFLAELKLLIDSTYFIGTYSSNVGYLASLYRGCDRRSQLVGGSNDVELDVEHVARKLNHYYQSYGVDQDEWSFI